MNLNLYIIRGAGRSAAVIVCAVRPCSTPAKLLSGNRMIVTVLLTLLWVAGAVYLALMVRAARARGQLGLNLEAVGLGAVTNFFDTLGIGSFAPTTAWLKLRKMVPDSYIPGTLNAGHCIPTIVEALVFIKLVSVDPILLVSCIVAATIGAVFGSAAVVRLPTHFVQGVVGVALVIASGLYAMQNLKLMPGGGGELALAPALIAVAVVAHFVLGTLMTFGIGLYAPSLIMLSLMGLDPKAAFPIMMGACAFLMPVSGVRFMNTDRIDMRVVLGIGLGGIPAVLLAAYAVTSVPLEVLRWGVVVVVLYAAIILLRAAFNPSAESEAVTVAP
jgi:uncharacterized membrane protein YfcA